MYDILLALLLVCIVLLGLIILRSRNDPSPSAAKYEVGDVTLQSLRQYCGYDWSKPPLVAIKGKIYDVSNKYEIYGPGQSSTI